MIERENKKIGSIMENSEQRRMRIRFRSLQFYVAIGLIGLGCALLVSGFLFPPRGEIHSSVLVAFGEIMTFAGAIFGIEYKIKTAYQTFYEKERED